MKKVISLFLVMALVLSLFVTPFNAFAMKNTKLQWIDASYIDFETVTKDAANNVKGVSDTALTTYQAVASNGGNSEASGTLSRVKYADETAYAGLNDPSKGIYGIKLLRSGNAYSMARIENIFDVTKYSVGDILQLSMDVYLSDVEGVTSDYTNPRLRVFLSKQGSSASGSPLSDDQVFGDKSSDKINAYSVTANEWVSIGFTFKVTQALIDEGISGLRIDSASETSHPYAKTTFIDNILVKKYSGESLKEADVDYEESYEYYNMKESVSVSDATYLSGRMIRFGGEEKNAVYLFNPVNKSEEAYVRTGIKSLVQRERTVQTASVKFTDLFNGEIKRDNFGEKYTVSLWVYADKSQGATKVIQTDSGTTYETVENPQSESTYFRIGLTGPNGQQYKYRSNAKANSYFEVKWNTWTKLEISHFVTEDTVDNGSTDALTNPMINSIRVDQSVPLNTYGADNCLIADTVYFDDLKVVQEPSGTDERYRRPVPTKFELSKEFTDDNLLYFEMERDPETLFAALPEGTKYITPSDLLNNTTAKGYATKKLVSVTGQDFTQALQVTTSKLTTNSNGIITTTGSSIGFKNTLEGCGEGDLMLVKFAMRNISGGDDAGWGSVILQVQGVEVSDTGVTTYPKTLFETVNASPEWKYYYVPFTHSVGKNQITIRVGTFIQTLEIADFEIINYANTVKADGTAVAPPDMPMSSLDYSELKKGSSWRQAAIARIEDIRKGDVEIVVRDANGYPITDADVKVDMYEHEFQFGTCVSGTMFTNKSYQEKLSENFNTVVAEHHMKWAPLEEQGGYEWADKMLEYGKALGIRHFRGHVLSWERQYGSNGTTNLTPDYMFTEEMLSNEEASNARVIQHINEAAGRYAGKLCDWDVVNEIVSNYEIRKNYKDPYMAFVNWFAAARKADPYADLYYNETGPVWTDSFFTYLDAFKEYNVDYDGIGIQSHYDSVIKNPSQIVDLYEKLRTRYGKHIKVTEYSCSKFDEILQANYTRDVLIASFAEENMDGFLYWGFWDGSLFADISPFYDKNWNLRGAGKVYQDLVYNKWWTREEGKTNSRGRYNLSAYYGDYDITVTTEDGYTETVSVPLYKNDEEFNLVEITLDDYKAERSEKDLFSFVHSGKIQIKGKVLLPEIDKNPDHMSYQASLVLTDNSKDKGSFDSIIHITQVPVKADGTYEIEFKVDNLDYGELIVEGCQVLMNVNGEIIEDNIATVGLIPDCVAFDITPTVSDGKLKVAIDFVNKIKRSGIDYTVYTAIYNDRGNLISMSRVNKTSTGDPSEEINLKDITLKSNAHSGKIIIWLNNGKMIPLSGAKEFSVAR